MVVSFDKLTSNSFISSDFNTSQAPIVVVCGWMDGNPKAVKKYAEMYSSLGYRTLVLISTSAHFLALPSSWVHYDTVSKVKEMVKGDETWIVHMMSNGGCRSWYCFDQKLKVNVKSMIFDSAPTKFDLNRKPPYHIFFPKLHWFVRGILLNLVMKPFFLLARLTSMFIEPPLVLHPKRFIHEQSKVPKLFLYSDRDQLVKNTDVEGFAKISRDLLTRVATFNFKDSDHVAHFQKYPNEYRSKVQVFLNKYT
jgi:hypothetical protein